MASTGLAESHPSRNGRTVSILVVDDDTLNSQVVSRRLTQEGYSVATAAGGQEALSILDRQRFDLILLDLEMPGMGGVETLKRIRAHKLAGYTPVIILSAYDDNASVKSCMINGASDYLTKPLVIPLVRARIERCLGPAKRRAREEHEEKAAPVANTAARILVVDDDELSCRLLTRQLEMPGVHATSVSNGETALELLTREPFDVALVDVNMPGMSGTELLQHLRRNELTRHLPVIVVTGTNDVSVMLECVDHGADGYLAKPVDIGRLRSCILSAVESHRLAPTMTVHLD